MVLNTDATELDEMSDTEWSRNKISLSRLTSSNPAATLGVMHAESAWFGVLG